MQNNLGLYIHIPFCNSKCTYCDFVSFDDAKDMQRNYVTNLIKEIEFESYKTNKKIDTIFIGGGTPSSLYQGALSQIFKTINDRFKIDENIEFSIEANPESCNQGFIKECVDIGVNRLSLGLQSACDKILKNIRKHTFFDFINAVSLAKKYKINNINSDIMLGLPSQSIADVINTIDEIIKLEVSHISVYGLKIEDGTVLQKQGYQVDEDLSVQMYNTAYQKLKAFGFIRYEVSNFAKKGFECRHNKKYWNLSEYLGVGLNASSLYDGIRKTNTCDRNQYFKGIFLGSQEKSDFLIEKIMLGLRTSDGVDIKYIDQTNKKLCTFIENGIVFIENGRLKIKEEHFYIMNSIISALI